MIIRLIDSYIVKVYYKGFLSNFLCFNTREEALEYISKTKKRCVLASYNEYGLHISDEVFNEEAHNDNR